MLVKYCMIFGLFIVSWPSDGSKKSTFTLLCLSNRINMLKSHIYMSSFHIYVQITMCMSKLQYIYPNCNICTQMVIYMSKMSIDMYPNALSFSNSSMYICHAIFRHIYIFLQVLHVSVHELTRINYKQNGGPAESKMC